MSNSLPISEISIILVRNNKNRIDKMKYNTPKRIYYLLKRVHSPYQHMQMIECVDRGG